jgi:hypothetical protein
MKPKTALSTSVLKAKTIHSAKNAFDPLLEEDISKTLHVMLRERYDMGNNPCRMAWCDFLRRCRHDDKNYPTP